MRSGAQGTSGNQPLAGRRRGALGLGAALLLAALALHATGAVAEEAEPEAGLDGVWVYSKSPAEGQAIIERAFEAALEKLDVITRSLARRKLKSSDSFVREITIGRPAGKISIRFVSAKTTEFVTRPGVAEKVKAPNGNEITLTQRFVKGALEQRFVGPRGTTVNSFTLSADAKTLTFRSLMEGERFDEPVRFELAYRRAGQQPPAQ